MTHVRAAWVACLALAACTTTTPMDGGNRGDAPVDAGTPPSLVARHSSSIAIRPDGMELYVVNPDADSVSVIDPIARTLLHEIALGRAPMLDASGRFDPAIGPRALALAPTRRRLYVSGQRSSELYEIDLATNTLTRHVSVGSEPIGVLVSADETSVFVACAEDASVLRIDLASFTVVATATTPPKPWALGWSLDGATLLATHLLGPGVSAIDPGSMTVRATWQVPDAAFRGDRLLSYGEVRGLYDVVARPGSTEVWSPHLLLATATIEVAVPAPGLDFESTVFPGVSVLAASDGSFVTRMTVDSRVPGVDGQFGDVVSGPHAIEFTHDGAFAFVVDTNSEDVLVIDAATDRRVQSSLLRPLPGHTPEGLVLSPDGTRLFVDERTSVDVAVITIAMIRDIASGRIRPALAVDGAPISRLAHDPMPATMRLGQQLFHSANSDAFAITQNHWVACASCHIEARSDAVVWRFRAGPRDTPSNAGGMLHTGFLLHTADRTSIRDYWHTINEEQGGSFSLTDPAQSMQLDALAQFVNLAIPYPVPPHTDPAAVARGQAIFQRADVLCATCHLGAYSTDSALGNATLDLTGTVLLHDVGTCNTGTFPDVAHTDVAGHARASCMFDTPSLRGVASSWPYFHDGSAATLHDVLEQTRGRMGNISSLSAADEADLIEYMRSL